MYTYRCSGPNKPGRMNASMHAQTGVTKKKKIIACSLYTRVFDTLNYVLYAFSLHKDTRKRDAYITSSVNILLKQEFQKFSQDDVELKFFSFSSWACSKSVSH